MNEEKAVAILMGNLKGSRKKVSNLLEIAEACRFLIEKWGIKEMSRYFRVSEFMIRQIDKINDLNPKLRKLVGDGKLGIEASYQLWRFNEPKRTQVANFIKDMSTEDIRTFVHFAHKNPDMTLDECKKLFNKTKPEKIRVLVLPLDSETYDALQEIAVHSKLKLHDAAFKVLKRGLGIGKKI
ncbi:MAG: hypothetical protein KGL95_13350 [Patescibacteria group bacterium]|nr:hypothetical protein [Patescibacteria group bacterium]